MAKMNFDFKQFMLQKGERVGLYAAGGLAVLLIVLGIIMLAGRDGSLSAGANAADMQREKEQKDQKILTNKPSEQKLVELTTIDPVIRDPATPMKKKYESSGFLLSNLFFPPISSLDERRREPRILEPTEFLTKAFGIQAQFFMFNDDKTGIFVLANPPPPKEKDDPKKNQRGRGSNPADFYGGNMMQNMMKGGGAGGGAGGAPSGPMGMMGSMPSMPTGLKGGPGSMNFGPGRFGAKGGHAADKKVLTLVKFEDLKSSGSMVYAEKLVPMHVAMIVGSFPLKAQIEEFQKALHAHNSGELFGGGSKADFRFLGIKVQRRTITVDGKETEWNDLPIEDAAKWWALNNGRRAEAETEDLRPILQWSNHLAMPRPKQFDDSPPYPPLESELPKIKYTLEELKKANKPTVAPNNPFSDENLDPYDLSHVASGKEMSGDPAKGPTQPSPGTGPGTDGPEGKGVPANPWAGQQVHTPEYALIRFLDIYLDPGKTYEYQVKVLMANPNYKRKDVREDLAAVDHLESPWTLVPQKLTVPEEIHYFAFDQRSDPKDSKRKFDDPRSPDPKFQTVLQIHKWLSSASPKKDAPEYPVGDWSVAEREVVYRGERIGQTHTVEVPIWMYDQNQFVLLTNPAERLTKDKHKIHVPFGASNTDAVLVDFTDAVVSYKRATDSKEDGGAPATTEVKDTVPQQVLILSPEGRLLVHDVDTDKNDKDRKDRLEAWRKRIEEMEKKNDNKTGKPGDDIFTKPGGPGGSGGQ
jgi:hypothetical protein